MSEHTLYLTTINKVFNNLVLKDEHNKKIKSYDESNIIVDFFNYYYELVNGDLEKLGVSNIAYDKSIDEYFTENSNFKRVFLLLLPKKNSNIVGDVILYNDFEAFKIVIKNKIDNNEYFGVQKCIIDENLINSYNDLKEYINKHYKK